LGGTIIEAAQPSGALVVAVAMRAETGAEAHAPTLLPSA
jgi:hypothetical protein